MELDINEFDEGDEVDCSECGAHYILKVVKGKFKLATEKDKYFEDEDFGSAEEETEY